MINLAISPEQERLEKIVEEYRAQGYEVIVQPHAIDLPLFLRGYQPDLVAHKGNQSVAVVVKTRQALAHNNQVREMARRLNETDDWQFDLVVVEKGENGLSLSQSLDAAEVHQNLDEAQSLLNSGHVSAAMLLAWSSVEATLRLVGQHEEPPIMHNSSQHMIKALTIEGAISRADYEFLLAAMQTRNAIAHGFRSANDAGQVVEELIETTQRLLLDLFGPNNEEYC